MTYTSRIVKSTPEITTNSPEMADICQSAENEAREIVAAAQTKANELLANAESEADRIVNRAQDRAELLAMTAKKELDDELSGAKAAVLLDHRKTINEDLHNSEQQLSRLVMDCVTKIVGDLTSVEQVSEVVRVSIQQLQNSRNVNLVVSPEDRVSIEQSMRLQSGELPLPIAKIMAEQGLQAGECYLDFGKSKLKLDLKSQLTNLKKVLNLEA